MVMIPPVYCPGWSNPAITTDIVTITANGTSAMKISLPNTLATRYNAKRETPINNGVILSIPAPVTIPDNPIPPTITRRGMYTSLSPQSIFCLLQTRKSNAPISHRAVPKAGKKNPTSPSMVISSVSNMLWMGDNARPMPIKTAHLRLALMVIPNPICLSKCFTKPRDVFSQLF